jgi:hypothetical protein
VVVVLVVQRGEDVLFVTAQADAESINSGGGRTEPPGPDCLRREIRKVVDGMVLAPRAVGER